MDSRRKHRRWIDKLQINNSISADRLIIKHFIFYIRDLAEFLKSVEHSSLIFFPDFKGFWILKASTTF